MFSLDTRQFWGSYRKSVFKYVRDLRVEERAAWTCGAQRRAAQPGNTSVSWGPCPHLATPSDIPLPATHPPVLPHPSAPPASNTGLVMGEQECGCGVRKPQIPVLSLHPCHSPLVSPCARSQPLPASDFPVRKTGMFASHLAQVFILQPTPCKEASLPSLPRSASGDKPRAAASDIPCPQNPRRGPGT